MLRWLVGPFEYHNSIQMVSSYLTFSGFRCPLRGDAHLLRWDYSDSLSTVGIENTDFLILILTQSGVAQLGARRLAVLEIQVQTPPGANQYEQIF